MHRQSRISKLVNVETEEFSLQIHPYAGLLTERMLVPFRWEEKLWDAAMIRILNDGNSLVQAQGPVKVVLND